MGIWLILGELMGFEVPGFKGIIDDHRGSMKTGGFLGVTYVRESHGNLAENINRIVSGI